jgi:hypothetical protein
VLRGGSLSIVDLMSPQLTEDNLVWFFKALNALPCRKLCYNMRRMAQSLPGLMTEIDSACRALRLCCV